MKLKDYQQRALEQVKRYLQSLDLWREKAPKLSEELGESFGWPARAWKELQLPRSHHSRQNGLGEELPNFVLKIPTGGGKTLLAVKAIDLINQHFTKRRTGLVTWIVPTTQIYEQTLRNLRNRDHPYRQHLDMASAGRTIIVEKGDRFTPGDVTENLVVLLLMLPSASRAQEKQLQLKFFRDNGGFEAFFPSEEQYDKHDELLKQFPNLDTFGDENQLYRRQVKTSLGNTLRILNPVVILDESQKGQSPIARDTLANLNPSIVVELSATPADDSNVLVDILGIDLDREHMIKLDLHVTSKASEDWINTLVATIEHRNQLEHAAEEYRANTGQYIRPISLIQVERTGRDQRKEGVIHAEEVREYLMKQAGIPADHIAVQSSTTKELPDPEELVSERSNIRYIITKSALQEGWDCAFAYTLTVLTNPQSRNALTQLVGRILRQPGARKTGVKLLDESYVFAYRQSATKLIDEIKKGMKGEGLGDLAYSVTLDETMETGQVEQAPVTTRARERFKSFADRIFLPVFVTSRGGQWQAVSYEQDIASRIDWRKVNLSALKELTLSPKEVMAEQYALRFTKDVKQLLESEREDVGAEALWQLDPVFMIRHVLDVVDNPWVAHGLVAQVIEGLRGRYDDATIAANTALIVEQMRVELEKERDRLAGDVFRTLLRDQTIRFLLLREGPSKKIPSEITYPKKPERWLTDGGMPLQQSLFDLVPEDGLNEFEQSVALYLDKQAPLFWWYRNRPREYGLQGWRQQKVYADFLFSIKDQQAEDNFRKIYVVETKGQHLMGSEDTNYKQDLFRLCNELASEISWNELGLELAEKELRFELVPQDVWQAKLNELIHAI